MPEHTRSLPPDEIAERLQTFSQSRESVNDLVGGPAVQAQAPPQQRSPFEAHSQTPHVHYDEADAEQQSEPPHPKKARPSLARAPSAFQENQRYRSMRFREKPGAVFTARDEANLINIPKNFQAKKGTALTDRLQIGDHISSGLQGGVYRVMDKAGQEVDLVVKVVHKHALLAEVEREWEVGLRLGFLAEEDGSLPGFMGTGAGLCDETGRFRGMLLERLDGRVVEKVIMRPEFADVHYLRAMLLSVFTALGKAQSWLGFHHADLRLANVMEIFSPRKSGTPTGSTPDYTVNGKDGHENGVHLEQDETEKQSYADTDTRKMSGLETDASQAIHHFKIIDYGLANFEETYACGPDLTHDEAQSPDRQSEASGGSFTRQPGCAIHLPILLRRDTVDQLPKISPVEQLYRYMWRRKGDVYHILFNLGEWLDGRVWPRKDQLEVLRLMDLIHHVTGQRLRAWFRDAKGTSVATHARSGWSDKAFRPINRSGAALHFLRRWHLRLGAWTNPSNPGLTAAEALTAPFFTGHKSLRTVVTGGSSRYSTWTQPAKSPGKRAQRYPAPR